MKKVIINTEITSINDITNKSIVGIQWNDGTKSMLYNSCQGFCVVSSQSNIIGNYCNKSQKEWVKKLNMEADEVVFVFKSIEERLKWFAS